MAAMAQLLDQKLQPINMSMSNIEHKLVDLRVYVDSEIAQIKHTATVLRKEQEEHFAMMQSNYENVHTQMQDL
eukprot:8923230-Karenia_brevis.AAC.1